MNKRVFPILIVFLIFSTLPITVGSTLQTDNVPAEVVEALGKGNARDVARHFATSVDLKLPGNEGTYSRNQAELILRNFFSRNLPDAFTIQHQGPSRDGSVYVIGNYRSKNGKNYRTYFLIKRISDTMSLHLLQMEEQ